MSELSEMKREAEDILESAIRAVAECLSFSITEDVVKSIRIEVIQEVLRLSKEE